MMVGSRARCARGNHEQAARALFYTGMAVVVVLTVFAGFARTYF